MEVIFCPKTVWALPPVKNRVDKKQCEEDAEVYEKGFRWLRRTRVPALCWPWRLAQEVGWLVPSPIDVQLRPLQDVQVAMPDAERNFFKQTTGLNDLWQRGDNVLTAGEDTRWMHLYEAEFNGHWDNMLYPLGEGYIEWRLGWGVDIPEDHYLMVMPHPDLMEDVELPYGILDREQLAAIGNDYGMAVALRPKRVVEIKRRQPIARLLLLHSDTLRAKGKFITDAGEG